MPQHLASINNIGLEKVKYLFIDGGALDSLLESLSKGLFAGQEIEIDYSRLAEGYHKVFYYNCLPIQKEGKSGQEDQERTQQQLKFFNYLKSLDKFHVYEGTARFRDKRRGQEQKEVDIMIAVDMLTHSFRRNMQEATLLAGDLDFKPLIDALVQDGMYVTLWYPKGRANYELVDAADSKIPLTISKVEGWFTDSFRSKIKLPTRRHTPTGEIDLRWKHVEEVKRASYKADFCKDNGNGHYLATVKCADTGYYRYDHNDLAQLKFYVEQLYGVTVLRPGALDS